MKNAVLDAVSWKIKNAGSAIFECSGKWVESTVWIQAVDSTV